MRRALWLCGLVLGLAGSAWAEELELVWRAPAGPTRGFVIERRLAGAAEFTPFARVDADARRFVDRTLPPGAHACYRVRAERADGRASRSGERCAAALPVALAGSGSAGAKPGEGYFLRLDDEPGAAPAAPGE
jgi:hypothetical protein